ncbi:hypothetical protein MLD38_013556 [Melastoma candidum]|uniref:Uncharacterized protein n=1 Tax=Melastoma candidum TaxID=119954 RepID=A0ACB9RDM8_9MYRT|nr:hypothetical protein MLD38_013556 [Melastoma candidum]
MHPSQYRYSEERLTLYLAACFSSTVNSHRSTLIRRINWPSELLWQLEISIKQPTGFKAPVPPLAPTDKGKTSRSCSFKSDSGSFKNGSSSFRNRPGSFRNGGFISHSSFSYEELAAARGGFGRETVSGHAGFGYVHKGVLSDGTEAIPASSIGTSKPNILLDMNFEAKVADFGLAKLATDNCTHASTRIMGNFGYLAPEYASSGKLTEKSDITIPCREQARPEIMKAMDEGGNFSRIADPRLEGNYAPHEMAHMVACAGACIRHLAKLRPKMSQVVHALEHDNGMEDLNEWKRLTDPLRQSLNSLNDYDTDSMRETPSRLGLNGSGSDERTTTTTKNNNNNNFDPSPWSPSSDGQLRGKDEAEKL